MSPSQRAVPLAYFLTFTCYGTWLIGRAPGSVDEKHNEYGTPFLPSDPIQEARMRDRMTEASFFLDQPRRRIVLATLQEVSRHRGWQLLAAHVRCNHIHLVVQGPADPDKMLDDYKAYCTRRLKEAAFDLERRKRWTEGGSTRFLWRIEDIESAICYVVDGQGDPMEVFDSRLPNPSP